MIPLPSHKEIKAESLKLEKPSKTTESTINPSLPGPPLHHGPKHYFYQEVILILIFQIGNCNMEEFHHMPKITGKEL